MKPVVITLTGGIGSGKSAVASCFADLGISIVDADKVSRMVMEVGQDAYHAVVRTFGEAILEPSGAINRPLLRDRVFRDADALERLEAIVHPLIREQILTTINAVCDKSPYVLLVIPLLFEKPYPYPATRICVVDCPEAVQIERTCQRDNLDEDAVKRILARQVSRETRLSKADDVIDNSGAIDALAQQVSKLDSYYRTL